MCIKKISDWIINKAINCRNERERLKKVNKLDETIEKILKKDE